MFSSEAAESSGSVFCSLAESFEKSRPSRRPSAEIETELGLPARRTSDEHDRAERQQRLALLGHDGDAGNLIERAADQHFQEIVELVRVHPVFVHDMQRIAAVVHVEPRKRTPGPADGVERAAARGGRSPSS